MGATTIGGIDLGFERDAAGNFTTFAVPGATSTGATGINNAGQIVGATTIGGIDLGFERDAAGNFTLFSIAGAASTQATGINDAGQIVGVTSIGGGLQLGFERTRSATSPPSASPA